MTIFWWVVAPATVVLALVFAVEWLRWWWPRRNLSTCTRCGAEPLDVSPSGGCLWPDGGVHCFRRDDRRGKPVEHICTSCAIALGLIHAECAADVVHVVSTQEVSSREHLN